MGRVPSDEKIPDDMSAEDKCTVRVQLYSADQSVPALLIPIRTHPIRTAVTLSVFIDSYSHTVL